jgi:hypothetical protein
MKLEQYCVRESDGIVLRNHAAALEGFFFLLGGAHNLYIK